MDRRTRLARPWAMVVLTIVLLAAVAGLVDVAWRGHRQDQTGRRGTVEVTGCRFVSHALHTDTYRCGGSFTAADGGFTIGYVTFDHSGPLDPGHRVAVRVAGPAATTGTEVSESRVRLIVTLSGAVLLAAVVVMLWRRWLHARRSAVTPDSPKTPDAATG